MAGESTSPSGAHDTVDNAAGSGSSSSARNDQHASISSQAMEAATASADLVEDEPGEGYGTVESVPGFDPARVLGSTRADVSAAPEAWDDFGHFDEERRDSTESADHSDFGFASYDESAARIGLTGTPPWQWVCQLVVKNADGTRSLGTGFLVAPQVLITAGRCVYDPAGGWAREIEVIPGLDGARRPWGASLSQSFMTVRGWFDNQDPDFDYGCIVLPEAFKNIGQFGLANLPSAALSGQVLNYAGYPADKQRGTQWFDACRAERATERRLFYRSPSHMVPVGSPLWLQMRWKGRSQRLVCGIGGSRGPADSAVRMNPDVLNRIKEWKQGAAKPKPGANGAAGAGAQDNVATTNGAPSAGQAAGGAQGGAPPS